MRHALDLRHLNSLNRLIGGMANPIENAAYVSVEGRAVLQALPFFAS